MMPPGFIREALVDSQRLGAVVNQIMPTSDMTVAEVLEQWPETVPVFQELKTACVGCVMAPFDTLADVARIYEMDLDRIMSSLGRAIT